jgi:hypothetical protein
MSAWSTPTATWQADPQGSVPIEAGAVGQAGAFWEAANNALRHTGRAEVPDNCGQTLDCQGWILMAIDDLTTASRIAVDPSPSLVGLPESVG